MRDHAGCDERAGRAVVVGGGIERADRRSRGPRPWKYKRHNATRAACACIWVSCAFDLQVRCPARESCPLCGGLLDAEHGRVPARAAMRNWTCSGIMPCRRETVVAPDWPGRDL